MKTFSSACTFVFLNLLTCGLTTPTNLIEKRDLANRQASPNTAQVVVCNTYSDFCGSGGDCHLITLISGTMASTPGTQCWYLPGIPHPPPASVPNIQFCNRDAGGGECHLSQQCVLNSDGSCDGSGTQSMGLSG